MLGIVDAEPLIERPRFSYFQGLPVQEHTRPPLLAALARFADLDEVIYFRWLDRPVREQLDLKPGFDAAVVEVMRRQPTGRINLIGYSTGGYAAMHIASQLVAHGRMVGIVALIDSSSYYPFKEEPALVERLKARGDQRLTGLLLSHLLVTLLHKRLFKAARCLTLAKVRLRGRKAAGDMISTTLALYWKEAVLRCPPRLYEGKVNLFMAKRGRPRITDPLLGWGPFAGEIEKMELEGNHWTLMEEPHAFDNAQRITRSLGLTSQACVKPSSSGHGTA